jgi:aspartate-semialdehyde dehydrogenase
MTMENLCIAVVGATGAVGREMINVIVERGLEYKEIRLLASERSAGEVLKVGENSVKVQVLTPESFEGVDIALFSAGGSVSAEFGPEAAKRGAIVIDNSSHFRMDPKVPLIVPEVNSDSLREHLAQLSVGEGTIIANPNCSTIQLVVALKPISEAAGLKRVIISTYQAVSGAGKAAMDELFEQSLCLFNQDQEETAAKFAHPIAFNCIPHCDVFLENDYTKEEMKLVNEPRKILGLPELRVTATAVRVPVFNSHSESVNIETERPLSADQAKEILSQSPGIILQDDPSKNEYPLARSATGTDVTYVGRVRQDESVENGLNMWIVADNLRKGAATNAVQIAEIVAAHASA